VEDRVEDLADRPKGLRPEDAARYIHLLPLQEIIGAIIGSRSLMSTSVWKIYRSLINVFGNEYSIVLDVPGELLKKVVDDTISEAILNVRKGRFTVLPGYDGVYGELVSFDNPNGPHAERHYSSDKFM
jgi:PHP family Zn ribbon phosphoesterase